MYAFCFRNGVAVVKHSHIRASWFIKQYNRMDWLGYWQLYAVKWKYRHFNIFSKWHSRLFFKHHPISPFQVGIFFYTVKEAKRNHSKEKNKMMRWGNGSLRGCVKVQKIIWGMWKQLQSNTVGVGKVKCLRRLKHVGVGFVLLVWWQQKDKHDLNHTNFDNTYGKKKEWVGILT